MFYKKPLAYSMLTYQTLFSDHRVNGDHVGVRQKLQVKVSVDKSGRSALLGDFVNIFEMH
jgi:hypothetical protein